MTVAVRSWRHEASYSVRAATCRPRHEAPSALAWTRGLSAPSILVMRPPKEGGVQTGQRTPAYAPPNVHESVVHATDDFLSHSGGQHVDLRARWHESRQSLPR